MKIVMLCEFYNEQLEYQENLLVKYYAKHGHAVTVITSTFDSVFDFIADRHDATSPPRTYEHGGAKIVKLRYRYNLLNRLRAYTSIERILEQERPDLIFVHDIMPNVLEAIRYKRRHPHCRMIMDYHADYSNSGKNWLSLRVLHGIARKWFLDRARPHLSRIFPVVPASATFLREVYGVDPAEMELLPLGADTDLGEQVRASGEGPALRRALAIPAEHTVIFTGGKLTPAKKTELVIEAIVALANPALHLVVAGDAADEHQAYKQQLVNMSRAANVTFVGWLSTTDVYRHLAMADLAVFPASQSILWQQAISMGLPLIVGAGPQQDISYLNAYGNIIILPPDQIRTDRIAQEIARVVENRQLRQRMREGALKVTDEWLNWNRLIDKTLRFNLPPAGR